MKKNKRNKKNNKNIWKTIGGNLIIWILVIIMAVTALQYFSTDYKIQVIDYTQFQEYIDQNLIEGCYDYTYYVTDSYGFSSNTASITFCLAEPNTPPVSVAGDDQELDTFKELDKKGLIQLRIMTEGVGVEKFAEFVITVPFGF